MNKQTKQFYWKHWKYSTFEADWLFYLWISSNKKSKFTKKSCIRHMCAWHSFSPSKYLYVDAHRYSFLSFFFHFACHEWPTGPYLRFCVQYQRFLKQYVFYSLIYIFMDFLPLQNYNFCKQIHITPQLFLALFYVVFSNHGDIFPEVLYLSWNITWKFHSSSLQK